MELVEKEGFAIPGSVEDARWFLGRTDILAEHGEAILREYPELAPEFAGQRRLWSSERQMALRQVMKEQASR